MNKKKDTLIAEYRHFRVYHEKVTIEGIEKTFEYVWRRDEHAQLPLIKIVKFS